MSFKVFSIQLHKWAALVVGIQLFLWVAGGLVMSLSDIDEVHGDLTKAVIEPKPLRWDRLVALEEIVGRVPAPITELSLSAGFFGPQLRLTDTRGVVYQFDAQTGKPLRRVISSQALRIAEAHYSGEGVGQAPIQVHENSTEYRGRLPVWRVDFDDAAATTLYVAVDNGAVVTRRNRIWRIYDFAWMLHIMDYRQRDDFNHWLLTTMSVLAVSTSATGLVLWTWRWPLRRRATSRARVGVG